MRILLIEDDDVLRQVMLKSLTDAGHRVDAASDLSQARHFWRIQAFDVVLLDLNLPESDRHQAAMGSGLTVLREARSRGDRTPVMVLTARNRTEERIAGLDAGADDYLGKPFDLGEVEARLRALVRRSLGASDVTQVGQLALDRKSRRFSLADVDLVLPAREFEVLWELMTPPGRAVRLTTRHRRTHPASRTPRQWHLARTGGDPVNVRPKQARTPLIYAASCAECSDDGQSKQLKP